MEDGIVKPAPVEDHTAAKPDATHTFGRPAPEQTLNVFLVVAALLAVCVYPEAAVHEHSPATRIFLALTFGLSMLMLVLGAAILGDEHRHVLLYKSTCYIFTGMVVCGSVAYILLANANNDSTSKAITGIIGGMAGLSLAGVLWVQGRNKGIIPPAKDVRTSMA